MPIRARLTLLVTVGAALLALLGAYLFLRELNESLTRALDDRLQQRSAAVASAVTAGDAVAALDTPAASAGGQAVEVRDARGHVVASTPSFVPPRLAPTGPGIQP